MKRIALSVALSGMMFATLAAKGPSVTGTYVVCLECGKEFPYDWHEMKVVEQGRAPEAVAEPVESYAGK